MTLTEMITAYNALTAAEGYIFGFIYDHKLYYVELTHLPTEILKFNRTSSKRGGIPKVRVRANSKFRLMMVDSGKAVCLGGEKLLDTADQYNKGERFERIITETLTAETWVKDSIPFNVAGDITLHGKQIQIKMDGAELTNEKTLMRIMAA